MKPRMIGKEPEVNRFVPMASDGSVGSFRKEPVAMTYDEFEAIRLIDYEGLMQEEAARKMQISRGTVWRCLDSARRKIATMLVEGRELSIIGG